MRDQIAGRTPLRWERVGTQECDDALCMLRGLRRSVLRCLDRDPARRPTCEALLGSWNHMFDEVTSDTATGDAHAPSAFVPTVLPAATAPAAAVPVPETTGAAHTHSAKKTRRPGSGGDSREEDALDGDTKDPAAQHAGDAARAVHAELDTASASPHGGGGAAGQGLSLIHISEPTRPY